MALDLAKQPLARGTLLSVVKRLMKETAA